MSAPKPAEATPSQVERLTPRAQAGVPAPVPAIEGEPDLSAPDFYLNRELTWLAFNYRVLHEAGDERTPLLERVKFLAIVGSNLDEFVMKRIGGLKQQAAAGMTKLTIDGRRPDQQIDECYEVIRDLLRRERSALAKLIEELAEHGIHIRRYADLPEDDRAWLRDYYYRNIFPLVTPQAMDPAHPFPFISNLSLNLLVTVRDPRDETQSLARVKVPVGTGIPRLLRVRGSETFVPLEQVLANNLDLLLPGIDVEKAEFFRVTRNANTEQAEDEADDLLAMIETELRERRFAPIVRLEVEEGMSTLHRGMLAAELGLDEESDVVTVDGMLGTRDLMELAALDHPELHDPPHHPIDNPRLLSERPIFHSIREAGSILLHHPYESFASSVERLLREASTDPKVRAIKMTLYRTSAKTNVIDHLINAAQNGKQVAVVVELKARFDESANIQWANRLEQAGVHVTYGVMGLKTHCKLILVVRQDYGGLTRYAHIGTGNYHAGTARLYSDLGLLTSDDEIGADLTELFNYLTTGYKPKRSYRKLLPAPTHLKKGLIERIQREIALHTPESPGCIQFKMNALEDGDVTRALYEASRAGVKVDLIVRDTCRLRPGIPGLSDNVRVVSIVGRFLEHARIYYFQNGGQPEYYIGSADLMQRNLESRVESVAPIEEPALQDFLRYVLDTQLADQRSAWEMEPDGTYKQRVPARGSKGTSSHFAFALDAEKRLREATRRRKRRSRGIGRRTED
ncbi:MAG: polyphosphate kinase 1 [Myxococcota bacterium]